MAQDYEDVTTFLRLCRTDTKTTANCFYFLFFLLCFLKYNFCGTFQNMRYFFLLYIIKRVGEKSNIQVTNPLNLPNPGHTSDFLTIFEILCIVSVFEKISRLVWIFFRSFDFLCDFFFIFQFF